jgi:hypothetical protein
MTSQRAFIGRIKRGNDIRGGMSSLQLEDFNIDGAIAAVDVGVLIQRNGETRLLGGGGGGN